MKNKLLLLVLIGLSLVWCVAWFEHVQAYRQMKAEDRERLGEEIVKFIEYYPLPSWKNGPLLIALGVSIATIWTCTLHSFYLKRKKLKNE